MVLHGVIMKLICHYYYIYNVINYEYNYIACGNCDYDYGYDYLRSCNRLQSITIANYNYPNHV